MADPAWFHSTLAQSVAALIGFVVAFTAAIYTNRKQSENEQIRRVWDCIIRLKDNYLPPLKTLSLLIYNNVGRNENWYDAFDDFSETSDAELVEWADEKQNDQSALAFAHLRRIVSVLQATDTPSEISPSKFEKVLESTSILSSIFSHSQPGRELYDELTENGTEAWDATIYWENIFEQDSGLESWFESNIPKSDSRRNRTPPEITGVTGRNIYSMSIIIEEFRKSFISCVGDFITDYPGETIYANSIWVLRISGLLALLGIFLPLVMLITVPKNPGGLLIFFEGIWSAVNKHQLLIQSLMLLVVTSLAGGLLYIVDQMVSSPNS